MRRSPWAGASFCRSSRAQRTQKYRPRSPPPGDAETFRRCKLDLGERERHTEAYALHRDLLRLRKEDPAIASASTGRIEGAVLSPAIFLLRYGLGGGNDRLLIVNLGVEVSLPALPEPLLAPPFGCRWMLEWSSEAVRYGGSGRASFDPTTACAFPGEAALLLRAERQSGEHRVAGVVD